MANLFAICGIAGSGKDTVAGMIKKQLSGYEIKDMSGKIKECAVTLFGISPFVLEDRQMKEAVIHPQFQDITGREFMESFGEIMRQRFGYDIWVRLLFKDYQDHQWIIPGVRKPVEADAVKSFNGYVVKVINPRVKPRGLKSEAELEQIIPDYIIHNDGSFFDLEFKVKKMLEQIK